MEPSVIVAVEITSLEHAPTTTSRVERTATHGARWGARQIQWQRDDHLYPIRYIRLCALGSLEMVAASTMRWHGIPLVSAPPVCD